MPVDFSKEQWAEIDGHILQCSILLAIRAITQFAGIGIREAIDVHVERYRMLRADRPADFACSDEKYWRETYS